MEFYVVFVQAVLLSTTVSISPPAVTKRYRSDYEYNEQANAFYKLHTESRRAWSIKNICQAEGADVMAPTNPEDIEQLHGMFKKYPDLGQYVWVASDGNKHEPVDEPAIINLTSVDDNHDSHGVYDCDVMTRSGDVDSFPCYRTLPFICKVEAKDAPYDSHCDVFANNYEYNATTGSCYKIPNRAASWNEAYAECRAEGAHLVVLNSEAEHAVVQALMQQSPKSQDSRFSWFFFAGYRANKPVGNETVVFKTVFNQTLQEAGFAEWSPNEPNNYLNNEYCGTLFKNDGKLNDADCVHEYAFICEKEIKTQN